ncbi:MAG: DUF3237 domain-containing protein [Pseudohongiellaceae bacterium]|jgi:hypothetical protein
MRSGKIISHVMALMFTTLLGSIPAMAQDYRLAPHFDFEAEFAWEAKVTIAPSQTVGESKNGHRNIIPITGGTFQGPNIRGEVMPLGEDWQLVRPDGVTELYARYLLRTDDGYLIQVINRVLAHNSDGESYRRSVIDLEAPLDSPYNYLNKSIYLGTLNVPESLEEGEEPYVIIGFYRLL